jgi:hypothetical protein
MKKNERVEKRIPDELKKDTWFLEKIARKNKEKKFDIEKIFDHDYEIGGEVKMAKKEKKTVKENLVFSFNTRAQGRVAESYSKIFPF